MKSTTCCRQLLLIVVLFLASAVRAQTPEFTYQGRLVDGASPANANYDFEFKLYDALSGGNLLGTKFREVAVANGIFTVQLDFLPALFDGTSRFVEIGVRPLGSANPFTVLLPRQPITSAPYSFRSLNANTATNSLQLGGVAAGQYVLTTDPRMIDARNPLPNSANYVQNTTSQQSSSNFNISGNGTVGGTVSANTVNATTQFNIGGNRILSNPGTANIFAGVGAGSSTTGINNSFFGRNAGNDNTSGNGNSFFGSGAGSSNTTSSANSFFGNSSGNGNTTGNSNSFFGNAAGSGNTFGNSNSYFGFRAGFANATGDENSFFGYSAGTANTANKNSFFGFGTGVDNTTGTHNSFFGNNAGGSNTTSDNNSFFGYTAGAANTANSNSFFGAEAGAANTTAGGNSFFGFQAGVANTIGNNNTFFGDRAGNTNTTGDNITIIGADADVATGNLSYATAIGAEAIVDTSSTIVLGRSSGSDDVIVHGALILFGLSSAGGLDVCRSASNRLSNCASSLRYKTDVQPFTGGLNLVSRLRPISFNWKADGMRDVGFGAEEVEQVEPLLVTRNAQGEIDGVKYKQITTVLVNAVNDQQAQIEKQSTQIQQQQEQIKRQQEQLDVLRQLVCQTNLQAGVCK